MHMFPIHSYLPRVTSSWSNVAHASLYGMNLELAPPISKNHTKKSAPSESDPIEECKKEEVPTFYCDNLSKTNRKGNNVLSHEYVCQWYEYYEWLYPYSNNYWSIIAVFGISINLIYVFYERLGEKDV